MQTYCQTTPIQATNSREQQRTHSREVILGAAVDCFARLGFEAVSIANIASVAGVKKSLVQYHFSTKVSPLQLLHLVSGMLSYNLLVAPMTKQATGVDLASLESIEQQVDILMQLLHPARR